ncbi:MAG: hypothetical protein HQM06_05270 [Magnetococcales bacterium]|nr:hypothetical protein [Magnetococcales bacterium]
MTRRLALGLALVVSLDTAGQLLWKEAVNRLPEGSDGWQLLQAALTQPWFALVGAIFLLQLINWLQVLQGADLSFALPITSLSYVTVAFCSHQLYAEPIGLYKSLGIVFVLIGVGLIGSGTPQSALQQKSTA